MAGKTRKSQLKRRQQVRRRLAAALAVMILAAAGWRMISPNQDADGWKAQPAMMKPADRLGDNHIKQEDTGNERVLKAKQDAQEKGFPAGVIKLLDKNDETIQFVENYEKKKDQPPAGAMEGNLTPGQIPAILQWDERWGYAPYGTSIVAVSGCGPTCLSMVMAGLNQDVTLTPDKVAAYGTEKGYVDADNNTLWKMMEEAPLNWGIKAKEVALDEALVKAELDAGHPVICSVKRGDFTQDGHFIVLTGYQDGSVTVNDPFSIKNSSRMWVFQEIKDQIAAMWAYAKE